MKNKTILPLKAIISRSFSSWKPGVNQPIPYTSGSWKQYTFEQLRKSGGLYNFLISSVVPRPIALVSTINTNGQVNCAPFSYFNVMSHDPPLLVLGLNLHARSNKKKDTLNNIEQTGQFVVNIMSSWYLESANHCSGMFSSEENEMKLAGLTCLPSTFIQPPRVAESAVHYECEVIDIQPRYNDENVHTVSIVTGRILGFHAHESVLSDESLIQNTTTTNSTTMQQQQQLQKDCPIISYSKLQPVGRMGGNTYTIIKEGVDLVRPKIKKA